jgi:hypothetical protein
MCAGALRETRSAVSAPASARPLETRAVSECATTVPAAISGTATTHGSCCLLNLRVAIRPYYAVDLVSDRHWLAGPVAILGVPPITHVVT